MPTVEIYHNVAPNGGGFFGLNRHIQTVKFTAFGVVVDHYASYQVPRLHPLVKVYEYKTEAATHLGKEWEILAGAWAMFNNGSGQEDARYFNRRLRSLSVGDLVVVDGRAWSVESVGFKVREPGELRITADYKPTWHDDDGHPIVTVPWQDHP